MADPPGTGSFKAAAEVVKSVTDLLKPFTDPALGELGEYVADKIRYLRVRNAIKVLSRAEELLHSIGIEPRPVAPRILVAVLEGAGLEEEDELVERWSLLLATAGAGTVVPPAFPSMLRELRGVEAKVLEVLGTAEDPVPGSMSPGLLGGDVRERVGIDQRDFALSTANLLRLGLIVKTSTLVGGPVEMGYDHDGYALSLFGREFILACQGPQGIEPT